MSCFCHHIQNILLCLCHVEVICFCVSFPFSFSCFNTDFSGAPYPTWPESSSMGSNWREHFGKHLPLQTSGKKQLLKKVTQHFETTVLLICVVFWNCAGPCTKARQSDSVSQPRTSKSSYECVHMKGIANVGRSTDRRATDLTKKDNTMILEKYLENKHI